MKELNTIEVEQVAGGGLLSSLISNVADTVGVALNTVSTVVTTTVPDVLDNVGTGVTGALNALGVTGALEALV
ncbi:hypothetical protein [Rouxiella badensis]|jgi:hypothetical protein|uniref:Uncharacterized protein n=1 Tax=Rouxiella badensis TaxID=1646377 RepID=A0A1X0WBS5_9GAMM|nr:hypothetical protein [Rouxiella badensis]MCC3703257.1 hypothetical protein [Rouxiella badensis]MCC3718196.1 hypothetical protein [Rouxiella badensis]MCC3727036.1 hypothetical protein [Rouxiella badensis]MCC3731679.1 hypothetical protein [Rouxiella badensis]MCC3738615.1 hypothetical protein [Rouxiella badensis]